MIFWKDFAWNPDFGFQLIMPEEREAVRTKFDRPKFDRNETETNASIKDDTSTNQETRPIPVFARMADRGPIKSLESVAQGMEARVFGSEKMRSEEGE